MPLKKEFKTKMEKEEKQKELEERSAPQSSFSQRGKRVLARLKNPGRPLKTIHLMKYVKAHKETLRPFRKAGSGDCVGWGMAQEAGQIHCISRNEKHAKALSIHISQDVNWRDDEKQEKHKKKAMLQ